jgi:hypothetical protein
VTVNITIIPPTEPMVELRISGVKNFQPTGNDSFILTASPADLRALYDQIQAALVPYRGQVTGQETI